LLRKGEEEVSKYTQGADRARSLRHISGMLCRMAEDIEAVKPGECAECVRRVRRMADLVNVEVPTWESVDLRLADLEQAEREADEMFVVLAKISDAIGAFPAGARMLGYRKLPALVSRLIRDNEQNWAMLKKHTDSLYRIARMLDLGSEYTLAQIEAKVAEVTNGSLPDGDR